MNNDRNTQKRSSSQTLSAYIPVLFQYDTHMCAVRRVIVFCMSEYPSDLRDHIA